MLPPRKAFYIITLLSLVTYDSARAQMVYATKSSVDADVKVYVTKYETDADLIVYKTAAQADAAGNKGIWYFAPYSTDAKKKIYFTDSPTDADVKICLQGTSRTPDGKIKAKSSCSISVLPSSTF